MTTIRVQLDAPALKGLLGDLGDEVCLDIARGTYTNVTRDLIKGMGDTALGEAKEMIRQAVREAAIQEAGLHVERVKSGAWGAQTVERVTLGDQTNSRLSTALRQRAKDLIDAQVEAAVAATFQEDTLAAQVRTAVGKRFIALLNKVIENSAAEVNKQLRAGLAAAFTGTLKAPD